MNINTSGNYAYPWNPKGRLCPLLDDPALWAAVLAEHQRRAVKTAAKRLGRREVISITDDQKVGELCCWLLQKFHSRKKLAHILGRQGYSFVHQGLWSEFYLENQELKILFPQESFTTEAEERIFMDTDAFSKRIREVMPKDRVLRSVAILGAAFAILQPDDAPTILQVLLDYEPSLEELLLVTSADEQTNTDQSASSEEKSDETQAETDHIDGSPGLPSNVPKAERPLTLTRMWIQGGLRPAEACLQAYSSLMRKVDDLQACATNLDLSKDTPMEAEASQLAKAAQRMHDAAADVDSWLDEWINPLQTSLSSPPETLRGSLGRLFDAFRAPRSSAAEMREVCENVRQVLSELTDIHTKAITMSQGLQQKVRAILTDLGRADSVSDDASLAEDLIKVEAVNAQLQGDKTRLGAERASLLTSRKVTCQARLEQIDPTSRISSETSIASFERLQEEVHGTCTLAELAAIEGRIQDLDENWPRLVPKRSLEDLAADTLQADGKPARVVDLARELAAAGRHAEAALLLELLQELYEPEAVEVDLPKFFESLLLSWSHLPPLLSRLLQLSSNRGTAGESETLDQRLPQSWLTHSRGFGDRWVFHALSGKWVSQMASGDLPEPAMRRRLVGAFLALHAAGASEPLMDLFYRLGLQDFELDEAAPNLRHLHRDVIKQRQFVISDGVSEKKIADAKRLLTEFFLQQANGDYIHQIAHGNAVADAERTAIFPALQRLVDSTVRDLEDGNCNSTEQFLSRIKEATRDAFRDHGLTTADSPFYHKKIFGPGGYLAALNERVQRFLSAQTDYAVRFGAASTPFGLAALSEELATAAAKDPMFPALWASVQAALQRSLVEEPHAKFETSSGVGFLLDTFPEAMLIAPELVRRFSSQAAPPELTIDDLRMVLERIAHTDTSASAVELQATGCLQQALVVAVIGGTGSPVFDAERVGRIYATELAALERQCEDISLRRPSNADVERAREAISLGKWPLAKQLLQNMKEAVDRSQADARNEARGNLQNYRDRIQVCQRQLENLGADSSADRLIELCGAASAHISTLIRQSQQKQPQTSAMANAKQLVEAIEFAVQNKSSTFSEIESLLGTPIPHHLQTQGPLPDAEPHAWGDDNPQTAWEFLRKQRKLNDDLRRESAKRWAELVRWFCRLSGMYHDLGESMMPSQFPGFHFVRYTSTFYSPRSAWLDRSIDYYLLLKTDDWEDQWGRLSAAIAENTDALSVVIVPEGVKQLRDRFRIGSPEDPFVLIGEEEAKQVSSASVPGAPLRQFLHRSAARLTDIGLFCTDGAVHSRKNLFVGRESALSRLEMEKASAVWGGRRIGKTSLLHALKERLTNPKRREPFRAGYVYYTLADPHADPDLILAKSIAEALALPVPESVAHLSALLTSACMQQRVAVLIDEVDTYIEASRRRHNDSSFPLIRELRKVSSHNQDAFKVVFAGFKQLYYEVDIRPNPDNAYPFKNFPTPIREDFGDLDAGKVEELLRIAFEDMLGIALEPGVARLVKERTSGHPAFVQEFGRQLLTIVERRRRTTKDVRITDIDVEAVYGESPDGTGGHSSYIDYVYQTLNWNLSSLGKAIMLAISSDIIAHAHQKNRQYQRDQILQTLEEWSMHGAPRPQEDDLTRTLKFLVMTNMLVRHLGGNTESYSIAYPSYIEFMVKLGDRDQIKVYESLMEYQKHEYERIL